MRNLLRWNERPIPRRDATQRAVTVDDLRRQIDEATRRYEALTRRVNGGDALNLFARELEEAECALTGGDPTRAGKRLEQARGHLERASAALDEMEAV